MCCFSKFLRKYFYLYHLFVCHYTIYKNCYIIVKNIFFFFSFRFYLVFIIFFVSLYIDQNLTTKISGILTFLFYKTIFSIYYSSLSYLTCFFCTFVLYFKMHCILYLERNALQQKQRNEFYEYWKSITDYGYTPFVSYNTKIFKWNQRHDRHDCTRTRCHRDVQKVLEKKRS